MELDLKWDPPLKSRWGAPQRLHGIRVFHDFEWRDVFPDERSGHTFSEGRSWHGLSTISVLTV